MSLKLDTCIFYLFFCEREQASGGWGWRRNHVIGSRGRCKNWAVQPEGDKTSVNFSGIYISYFRLTNLKITMLHDICTNVGTCTYIPRNDLFPGELRAQLPSPTPSWAAPDTCRGGGLQLASQQQSHPLKTSSIFPLPPLLVFFGTLVSARWGGGEAEMTNDKFTTVASHFHLCSNCSCF